MTQRLTCEEAVSRLTDLAEGSLSIPEFLRLHLHLLHCHECRALKLELSSLPQIVQNASRLQGEALLPLARTALQAALARIPEFRPVQRPQTILIPSEIEALLRTAADSPLRLMEATFQAFAKGTVPLQAPFLPEVVMAQLPAPETWRWRSRGGARIATLLEDASVRLSLLVAPRGFQTLPHVHHGSEQMLVLDGLLEDGLAAHPTGRWVHFGEGTSHAPVVLNDECWCLIREEGSVRYTGPLGWLRNILAA